MHGLAIIDVADEALAKAYHRGRERGALITSPRTEPEWDNPDRPRPLTRTKMREPRISAAEAEAEVERDLLTYVMEAVA